MTTNPRKDAQGVDRDNILTRFHGVVSHDHEAKFYHYGDRHATCGAHLLRDLKALLVLYFVLWAADVRKLFQEMNAHKKNGLRLGATACEPDFLCRFEARYDELVAQGQTELDKMHEKTFGRDELVKWSTDCETSRIRSCYSCVITAPHSQTTKRSVTYATRS